jgi:hypothetical protein
MEIVGWVFIGVLALVVLGAIMLGVMSIPDAKRYLQLRRM